MHIVLLFFNAVVCRPPSTAASVIITNTPTVTIGGSILTFTCSGDNEVRASTCGSIVGGLLTLGPLTAAVRLQVR